MKSWMRVFVAVFAVFLSIVCAVVTMSAGAAFPAHAQSAEVTSTSLLSSEGPEIRVDCQVKFLDGPQQGQIEPDDFLVDGEGSGGGLISYTSAYVGGQSLSGSWSSNGSTSVSFTFTADLVPVPGGHLTVNETFPTNTSPVVANGTGKVSDANWNLLYTTDTQVTCPYFLPLTSDCQTAYSVSYGTSTFTATIEFNYTGSTPFPAGGTLVFISPDIQTITSGSAPHSQSGETITLSNLPSMTPYYYFAPILSGEWSIPPGTSPQLDQFSLNGTPCTTVVKPIIPNGA